MFLFACITVLRYELAAAQQVLPDGRGNQATRPGEAENVEPPAILYKCFSILLLS